MKFPNPLPPGWKKIKNELFEALGATPELYGCFYKKPLFVTMTTQVELDGKKWLHVAVSKKGGAPSYYDLCEVKRVWIGNDKTAYQLFVGESKHVNIHKNCHHLWCCLDGAVTPDFTWGTGSI